MLNGKVNFGFSIMKKLWDLVHEKLVIILGGQHVGTNIHYSWVSTIPEDCHLCTEISKRRTIMQATVVVPELHQSDHTVNKLIENTGSLWNTVNQTFRPQVILKTQPPICLDPSWLEIKLHLELNFKMFSGLTYNNNRLHFGFNFRLFNA